VFVLTGHQQQVPVRMEVHRCGADMQPTKKYVSKEKEQN
jgi:hypothetical protein